MKSASDRLTDAKDPGLGTQRIQEEVVKTLDRLLEEAQKQQGKKSSSSKKKQQQKQGGKDQKQDPSEQNGQQQKPRPSRQSGETSKPSGDPQESSSDAQRDDVFTYTSGGVFNQLMQFCLSSMDEVLRRHVAGGAAAVAAGAKTKAGLDRPDAWAHWRKHQPLVKSYLTHLLQFAGQLSEASMIAVTLQQMHRLLPFYFCLPKLCPKLLKATLRVWAAPPGEAGGAQQNTLLGFAIIRQLACSLPYPFVEHCLKGLYLAYAQASSRTNRVTLQHLVLDNSAAKEQLLHTS
jgi:hypothetical protein